MLTFSEHKNPARQSITSHQTDGNFPLFFLTLPSHHPQEEISILVYTAIFWGQQELWCIILTKKNTTEERKSEPAKDNKGQQANFSGL